MAMYRFLCVSQRRSFSTLIGRHNEAAKVVAEFFPLAKPVTSTPSAEIAEAVKVMEERQVFHPLRDVIAIDKVGCKYGFPRAYLQLPVSYNPLYTTKRGQPKLKADGSNQPLHPEHSDYVIQSSCIRLSCPHLVKAIDKFEYEGGGIAALDKGLSQTIDGPSAKPKSRRRKPQGEQEEDPQTSTEQVPIEQRLNAEAKTMRAHFTEVNQAWKEIRNKFIAEEDRPVLLNRLKTEENVDRFVNSGIGGVELHTVDQVKCLHMHVADALLRGEDANKFGRWTLRKLREDHDVHEDGGRDCWQQCNRAHQRTDDSFWYVSPKNQSGITQRNEKRKKQPKKKGKPVDGGEGNHTPKKLSKRKANGNGKGKGKVASIE